MYRLVKIFCFVMLLAIPTLVPAQTAYVIDQLQVGVHTERSLHSPLVKVLSTGTALEIVESDETFARVTMVDGTQGWVDARYLSAEKPASLLLEEAASETAKLRAELSTVEQSVLDVTDKMHVAQERAALSETTLEAVRQTQRELEDALGEARRTVETPVPSDMLRDMQHLAEENQELKQQLAALESSTLQDQSGAESVSITPMAGRHGEPVPTISWPNSANPFASIINWHPWQWMLLGSTLLLAFGIGGYLVDYSVRRRHGGFRV